MSGAAGFQSFIDAMLGAVGQAVGSRYAAYRVTAQSSGDFPTGWTLLPQPLYADRNRVQSKDLESNLMSERAVWYELAGNLSPFRLGDVFIRTSDISGVSSVPGTVEIDGVALAWHAPVNVPIGARLSCRAGIYRPSLAPGTAPDGSLHWQTTHDEDTPLVLTNGTYGWGTAGGTASWVPIGLGTNDRASRGAEFPPDTIGIPPTPRYIAYVPPLPGFTVSEGDLLIAEDGARYSVISPYRQETGMVGSQLLIERYISQTT